MSSCVVPLRYSHLYVYAWLFFSKLIRVSFNRLSPVIIFRGLFSVIQASELRLHFVFWFAWFCIWLSSLAVLLGHCCGFFPAFHPLAQEPEDCSSVVCAFFLTVTLHGGTVPTRCCDPGWQSHSVLQCLVSPGLSLSYSTCKLSLSQLYFRFCDVK